MNGFIMMRLIGIMSLENFETFGKKTKKKERKKIAMSYKPVSMGTQRSAVCQFYIFSKLSTTTSIHVNYCSKRLSVK